MDGGGGGGVWFVLFSEATPFENNVSTILPPILVSPDQHTPCCYLYQHKPCWLQQGGMLT